MNNFQKLNEQRAQKCKRGHDRTDPANLRPNGRCKLCQQISTKAYTEKNKDKLKKWHRHHHVEKAFGLPGEAYEQKLKEQNNKCKICERLMAEPNVDHDHTTDEVRDLLCHACNVAIGFLQDDPLIAQAAADYLRRWKTDADN